MSISVSTGGSQAGYQVATSKMIQRLKSSPRPVARRSAKYVEVWVVRLATSFIDGTEAILGCD